MFYREYRRLRAAWRERFKNSPILSTKIVVAVDPCPASFFPHKMGFNRSAIIVSRASTGCVSLTIPLKTLAMKQTIFLLLLFCSGSLMAQNIKGKLLDEKGAPIAFANVALLKASDSSLHVAGLTGKDGSYTLAASLPGRYFLRFSSIGFSQKESPAFEVAAGDARDGGNVVLQQDSKTLQEVNLLALRPTIVQKADRLVVSVEGTAMAAGNTAYAVLARAPGVFIDPEGNIQLNGRSGVTVMLDGKLTYLSARDLRTMLEGMAAENLKNIEIITNPSAKFDAEGTSGILNINLKKNTLQGMNGSVYSGYNYNFKQHAWTAGGNINYKSGRWNSFVNIDAARRVGGREATFTRVFYDTSKTTYFDQNATGNFVAQGPPSGRAGTEYTFNSKHSLGVMASFNRNTANSEFLTETFIGTAPKTPSSYVAADNYARNTFSNLTTNLHYGGKWDTLGTLLTADLDYAHITNRGYSSYYNYFTNLSNSQKTQDLLFANTPNGYDIYSAKVDFTKPLRKEHKLETGGRYSRVQSDNDFRFYFNNGGLVLDPLRTNHFRFRENIYAAYANWNGPLSKKITAQAGLRMEHTQSLGASLTIGTRTPRRYTNFFPSLFVQQKVSDNYGINYSYSYRITRPNYGNLNPFRAYRDPYTWYQGNTTVPCFAPPIL